MASSRAQPLELPFVVVLCNWRARELFLLLCSVALISLVCSDETEI